MIEYQKVSFIDILRNLQLKHEIKEFMVTDNIQHRPDIIQSKIYGNVSYYPFILIFNHIDNIYSQLNTGDIIYYPNIQDIEEFIYNQKIKQL